MPRSSSPAVAAAAAVVATAISTSGIIIENISAFRKPAPVVYASRLNASRSASGHWSTKACIPSDELATDG